MYKSNYKAIITSIVLLFAIACTDNVSENWTTFKGESVSSFLEKDTAYSEFSNVLNRAGFRSMLRSYSRFTCFAPTNEAMRIYYHSHGTKFTIDNMRPSQLDSLAKSHLLANVEHTYEFGNGVLSSFNLNYDFLEVHFDDQQGGIVLNGSSRIVSKDNDVYNGVVHGINRVLKTVIDKLPELMVQNPGISIFNQALYVTHLSDSIIPVSDMRMNAPKAYYYDYIVGYSPYFPQYKFTYAPQRKFGYTVFVEDDNLLKANGINNLDDLIERAKGLYPGFSEFEQDFTNPNNSLNRYIAYHIIKKAIYNNRFFYTGNAVTGYTPDEFLETMLHNRIIRVSNISAQVVLNPESDYAAIVQETFDQRTKNGVYYLLNHLLVYSNQVERILQNTRIRFDVASLLPELTNNNIRCTSTSMPNGLIQNPQFYFEQGYLSNIKASKETNIFYICNNQEQSNNFPYYQSDALVAQGQFDFSIRLLPVPPGTYEIRFGAFAGMASIVQLYIDNKPKGIPVNLNRALQSSEFGYLLDSETNDNGLKYDQILRYKGYMKGPNSFWTSLQTENNGDVIKKSTARESNMEYRKIVDVISFTDYEPHTIRIKSVAKISSCLAIDYFELVPKSVFQPVDGEPETRD